MATWKNVSEDVFKIDYPGDSGYSGKRRLTLQYDADSETPESVTVRFKWYQPGSTYVYGADIFYILYDANNTSNLRSLYKLKPYGSGDKSAYFTSDYNDNLVLKKDATSKTFFLQDIWICNSGGSTRSDPDAAYNTFKSGGSRGSLAYRQTAGQSIEISPDTTVATNVGVPDITIKDNYNNTFTINVTKGADGTNNPAKGLTNLYWGYSESDVSNKAHSYINGSIPTITTSGTGDTRTVHVGAATVATYGYNHGTTKSRAINQYLKPNNPGKPVISYTKSRFTPKERIIYKWTAATAKNKTSPVVGYRVRLWQQKAGTTTWKNIPIWSTTSNTQKSELVNGEYIYDREVDDPTYISLGHEIHGFEVGDKVKLSIQAYSRFGNNNTGDNSKLLSDKIESTETEIQSAGTMRVKVGDKWKEGQVYIKVGDKWKEAESVHIKTSTGWAEST